MICSDIREAIFASLTITCVMLISGILKAVQNESALKEEYSLILKNDSYANTSVPFLCSLQKMTKTGNDVHYKHICGCTIIDKSSVLTAAHCVHLRKNEIKIMVGLNSSNDKNSLLYSVKMAKKHPSYIAFEGHDIALLKIVGEFDMDGQTVDRVDVSSDTVGTHENILLISHEPKDNSSQSQFVMFRTLPAKACYHRMKTLLINNQFCAVSVDRRGATEGDSGSPVVDLQFKKLIGIVSFGRKVRHINDVYVFTKIHTFYNWIQTLIKEDENL